MDAQTKVYELRAIEKELMALEERQAQFVRRRRMLPVLAGLRVPAKPFRLDQAGAIHGARGRAQAGMPGSACLPLQGAVRPAGPAGRALTRSLSAE